MKGYITVFYEVMGYILSLNYKTHFKFVAYLKFKRHHKKCKIIAIKKRS